MWSPTNYITHSQRKKTWSQNPAVNQVITSATFWRAPYFHNTTSYISIQNKDETILSTQQPCSTSTSQGKLYLSHLPGIRELTITCDCWWQTINQKLSNTALSFKSKIHPKHFQHLILQVPYLPTKLLTCYPTSLSKLSFLLLCKRKQTWCIISQLYGLSYASGHTAPHYA